jgi:magnesium transporter
MHVLDHFDAPKIRALCASGEFFWLDLVAPSDEELDELAGIVGIPDLALEDTKEMGQRAKIDDYDDRLLIVFYGAQSGSGGVQRIRLVEVHMHLTQGRVVTVHRDPCSALDAVRKGHPHSDQELVYRILDALSESMLTALREIETEVTRLEDAAFTDPSDADRRRIVQMRGRLFRLLQVIVPQRDMLGMGADAIERVLGIGAGQAHHPFQDIRDDLVSAVNLGAYCRELLAEALNVHLQATSNRLNAIATRLAVLASIFVPLTLVTGYFGQNFGWMVDHIDSFAAFLIFGVGGIVVPGGAIWLWLKRSGYLNSSGQ